MDNLQSIIGQKEEIIKRLQTLIKENGEKHSQAMTQLLNEIKMLQDTVDTKEQACNRYASLHLTLALEIFIFNSLAEL